MSSLPELHPDRFQAVTPQNDYSLWLDSKFQTNKNEVKCIYPEGYLPIRPDALPSITVEVRDNIVMIRCESFSGNKCGLNNKQCWQLDFKDTQVSSLI